MGGYIDEANIKLWPIVAFMLTALAGMIRMWFKIEQAIISNKDAIQAHISSQEREIDNLQRQHDNLRDQYFEHHKNAADRYNSLNERIDEVLKILIRRDGK